MHPCLEFSSQFIQSQNALGRVSFTADMWSDPNLVSFMAVTTHYCDKDENDRLVIQARLLAFREIEGDHTGVHLARIVFNILKDAGLLHKVLNKILHFCSIKFDTGRLGLSLSTMLPTMICLWRNSSAFSELKVYHLTAMVTESGLVPEYLFENTS